MSKINKAKISYVLLYSLLVLGIFILGIAFTFTRSASAELYGGGAGYSYISQGHDFEFENNYSYNVGNEVLEPIVTSITPNRLATGSNTRIITIYGRNFTPGTVAKIGSQERPTSYQGSNRLQMQLSQNDVYRSGEHLVSVYTPGGGYSNVVILTISGDVKGAVRGTANTSDSYYGTTTESATRGLGANASSSGFSFSGLFGWLLLGILILIVIVLWRKVFGDKERQKPLKHA
jgi:hypothetical protein